MNITTTKTITITTMENQQVFFDKSQLQQVGLFNNSAILIYNLFVRQINGNAK